MAESTTKRAKSGSKQEESASQITVSDRISNLPDYVLRHILAFLPTKDAIGTSLLSKRWRPLWFSLPTVDFDVSTFPSVDFFLRFVDTVLILRDLTPIKKFRLTCVSTRVPPDRIIIWISSVISRKVEALYLHFSCNYMFGIELPSGIFDCSTIRILELRGGATLNSFSSVNLPLLESLHLENVRFLNFKCVALLLSGCVLLKALTLRSLHVDDYSVEDIGKLTNLISATIQPDNRTNWRLRLKDFPLKAFSNVKSLSLESLSLPRDDIPRFYHVTDLRLSCCSALDWTWTVNFLRNLAKLENFFIRWLVRASSDGFGMERMMAPITDDIPQCVSSHLKKFDFDDYKGSVIQFEFVKFIMMNAKVLRTITIRCSYFMSIEKKYEALKSLSSCPRGSENCRLLFD